jgi:hypothetical protein
MANKNMGAHIRISSMGVSENGVYRYIPKYGSIRFPLWEDDEKSLEGRHEAPDFQKKP